MFGKPKKISGTDLSRTGVGQAGKKLANGQRIDEKKRR